MLEDFPWKQPAQHHPISQVITVSGWYRQTPNLGVLAQQKHNSHLLKVQDGS